MKPKAPPKDMWAIPVTVTGSESTKQLVETLAREIITKLGGETGQLHTKTADIVAEWEGPKHIPHQRSSNWGVKEQFAELSKGTKDGPVILYMHGGGYVVGSIESHRLMTKKLAEDCGGRTFALAYRLAPQHEFPAALVDAIYAYKYLIDPPPGALHEPVDPKKIVIAGDSAGVRIDRDLN